MHEEVVLWRLSVLPLLGLSQLAFHEVMMQVEVVDETAVEVEVVDGETDELVAVEIDRVSEQ